MIFRAIRLNNFGIYAGTQVIEPVVGRNGERNITLIGGLNGRGKTSLLDAVLLALYGNRSPSLKEQRKTYSEYLQGLVHSRIGSTEESFVELDFETPMGGQPCAIRLRRSWRLRNKRYTDKLMLWRGGVPDPHLADNWPSHVEDLLPSGLAGLFFFDGEKIASLAEADETEDGLKHSIRSLLGLDLVDRLIADMATVIRRNEARLGDSTAREEMQRLYAERQKLEQKRTCTIQTIAEINAKIGQLEGRRLEKEQSFYEAGGRLAEEREALREKEFNLSSRIQELKSQAVFMASGPSPLLLVLPMLQQVRSTATREEAILEAHSALRLLQARDERFLRHLEKTIGVPGLIGTARQWLSYDRGDLEQLASDAVVFNLSANARAQLDHLMGSVDGIQQGIKDLLADNKVAQVELEQVKEHLDIYVDEDKVQSALVEMANLTRSIARLEQQRETLQHESLSEQRDLERVERRMTAIATDLASAEDTERTIRYAGRTQEAMRIYREKATRQKIGVLTQEIAMAFDILTHKSRLVSTIRMDTETLRISLYDTQGREIPKSRLSSGEKQMLAIAILWGLAKASGRSLPVIIDTPMGRLDSSHRMNFVTRYLPNASHQVIVLSTDTEIVGPYLKSLANNVGKSYLLLYNEEQQRTEIQDGYFEPIEVIQ